MTTVATAAGGSPPTVLFLDKVFLKRVPEPLRGVELFNLHLLRDLVRLGYPVTLIAEISWQKAVLDFMGEQRPQALWFRALGPDALATPLAGWCLRGRTFDRLLVGNVGNGLLPLVRHLHRRRAFARAVLIAHREAAPRFVKSWSGMPGCVVAVNQQIARPFQSVGSGRVAVDYGIVQSDRYFPPSTRPEGPVRFIVLGALDNPWKGADTAQAAFARLPAELCDRAELHLASYRHPPTGAKGVVAHPWLPLDEIPGLLRRMQVMICPSRDEVVMRETFSQAMVQGMLTGLPVLASDLPILTEKLDSGGGLIFHNEAELADHMARMIREPELREHLGQQARTTALDRYRWDTARFAARYLEPLS